MGIRLNMTFNFVKIRNGSRCYNTSDGAAIHVISKIINNIILKWYDIIVNVALNISYTLTNTS